MKSPTVFLETSAEFYWATHPTLEDPRTPSGLSFARMTLRSFLNDLKTPMQLKLEPSSGRWRGAKVKMLLSIPHFGSATYARIQNTLMVWLFRALGVTYPHPPARARGLSKLGTKLKELLSDNTFSDLTITAGGRATFLAHKAILAVRSPVFRAMFQTMMTETLQFQVDLSTFPAPVVKGMLEYIYTDLATIDLAHTGEYLRIADLYELDGLKAGSNIKVNDALETFQFAILYIAMGLKDKVVQFLKRNGKAVSEAPGFSNFVKSNPNAAVELFSSIFN